MHDNSLDYRFGEILSLLGTLGSAVALHFQEKLCSKYSPAIVYNYT